MKAYFFLIVVVIILFYLICCQNQLEDYNRFKSFPGYTATDADYRWIMDHQHCATNSLTPDLCKWQFRDDVQQPHLQIRHSDCSCGQLPDGVVKDMKACVHYRNYRFKPNCGMNPTDPFFDSWCPKGQPVQSVSDFLKDQCGSYGNDISGDIHFPQYDSY